jgi:ATP synthase protein I
MAPPKQPDSGIGLEGRREALEAELNRKTADDKLDRDSRGRRLESNNGMAYAVKVSSEFIAGIIVGVGIGWLIDKVLGTSPFGLIIFLILGFCAGILSILRNAGLIAVSKSERGFDLRPSDRNATPKGNAWADDEED